MFLSEASEPVFSKLHFGTYGSLRYHGRMRSFLVALFTWLPNVLSEATFEDSKLPSDEEVLQNLLSRQGQPEEETSLGLPTDEESFNEIKSFLLGTNSEIDARGFHESVFNGIGDYFSLWPKKRTISDDIYPEQMTNEDLGIFHLYRGKDETFHHTRFGEGASRLAQSRGKRQLPSLVQSCSLPGITCDPFSQNGGEITEISSPSLTPTKTLENLTETTTTPAPKLTLPVSTRYLVRRSLQADASKIGLQSDVIAKDGSHRNRNSQMPTVDRLLGVKGVSAEDEANRVVTVNYILSKLLAELEARRHLKRALQKQKPEMKSSTLHSYAFFSGFGEPDVMKRKPEMSSSGFHGDTFNGGFGDFDIMKRRPEMSSFGFHSDAFTNGFGEFDVMKRKPKMSSAFHEDTFTGRAEAINGIKRKPETSLSGFHEDTFNGGFGDFDVMKRRLGMLSPGFHGDTFDGGFDEFNVMKRKLEMSSTGFHDDAVTGGPGDFDAMKRKPKISWADFQSDAFTGGFDKLDVMKRKPEMSSSGFHGDMFNGGFGEFNIMKRNVSPSGVHISKRCRVSETAHHGVTNVNNDYNHKSILIHRPQSRLLSNPVDQLLSKQR
ncbi:uncharacterized protein [Bemisia tabaci]|uniref:uncharacterized protein isoform X2 n=2 Tax=Bemisia tabaci TaxID=7038 RepID=UPI003B27FF5C